MGRFSLVPRAPGPLPCLSPSQTPGTYKPVTGCSREQSVRRKEAGGGNWLVLAVGGAASFERKRVELLGRKGPHGAGAGSLAQTCTPCSAPSAVDPDAGHVGHDYHHIR